MIMMKIAETLDDVCKLLEVGFEHITDMDGKKYSSGRENDVKSHTFCRKIILSIENFR
jgi:hypothetical protein